MTLRVRWLGRLPYAEALDLQRALHARTEDDYLLLLEHPHVYTLGKRADPAHVLTPPAAVGAELVRTDRGGDVTYHGPGQLVGYPIVTLDETPAGMRDVVAHVRRLETALIDVLAGFGLRGAREDGLAGVWVNGAKIAAIGVRVARGRTMHGFALNVDPDLAMFGHIVPCGIADRGVTSLAAQLGEAPPMRAVVDACIQAFSEHLGGTTVERADVAWERAAVPVALGADPSAFRRPEWMKVRADLGPGYRRLKRLVRDEALHTVCEEAGCPNIFECWSQGTATFMILGERCTRACGYCLVDTRKPLAVDPEEPERVADAVGRLGLAHAVITSVARDDVADGGASAFAATIGAVRRRNPTTTVEVLIPDCKGDPESLDVIFAARPDVLNHNLETVARLQRSARPSAGYARSLTVLARAKDAGLVTKSGLILGMGETDDEVRAALIDLRAVGTDIVTLGQYLRPSRAHLPVARWWTPDEFAALGDHARALGFAHVESGPLVRSSYHARDGAAAIEPSRVEAS
ncbi:MAG: lipoyl synthase [Actinobacteria bacterium]|nr:lipoyl synthase [Actinomycetota bacterium]